MIETTSSDRLAGRERLRSAPTSWWKGLLQGLTPGASLSPVSPGPRPVWTVQRREYHREGFGPPSQPPTFYMPGTFYARLGEELELAKRQGEPLSVVVLQLPDLKEEGPAGRRQRELEIALRLAVRGQDLPARLSPSTLAVGLPHTGATVDGVARRLQRLISRLVDGRIVVGTACFPADGSTALELLRAATWRSMTALSGSPPDPELTRLLGPINPGGLSRPAT